MRLELLQKAAKNKKQRDLLEESYTRLCSPEQMGEIYKILYMGHRDAGEVFPFLGEETRKKES